MRRLGCVHRVAVGLGLIGLSWLVDAASPAPREAAGTGHEALHELVFRNGTVYDGSGGKPYSGDIAVDGDRIVYVGPHRELHGRTEVDVKGQAIAPGFINMLAHPEESFFADGRALS